MFIPSKEEAENIAKEFGTPTFVTDSETVRVQAEKMIAAFRDLPVKIFYAIKTNANPHIVRLIKESGIYGIDAVSVNEVRLALDLGYRPEEIIFTPSNPSSEAIKAVGDYGVLQNLGSLSELTRFCALFPDTPVSVRVCPEICAGEFEANLTGGIGSKFGISLKDIEEARAICARANVPIVGIHGHIGSGFYEPTAFRKALEALCAVAELIPDIAFIDIGGGYGVRYRPEEPEVDMGLFAAEVADVFLPFARQRPNTTLYLEPGKFLVSTTTVLLTRITTIKEKDGITFVGLDTGFNHLIRPAMYGAYHHIVNLSKPAGQVRNKVTVVGYLCESADVFSRDTEMTDPEEGDLVAILVAGGHGSVLSSNYNLQELAAEVLVREGGAAVLTKRRQTYADIMALFMA